MLPQLLYATSCKFVRPAQRWCTRCVCGHFPPGTVFCNPFLCFFVPNSIYFTLKLAQMSMATSALYNPYDVRGQVALVTGASSGFGEATAWRLAEAGCKLVLTARRIDRLLDLKQQLVGAYQVPVHAVQLDMRDLEAVKRLAEELPSEFREVDILINNAGLALDVTTVSDHLIQDAQCMIETNYLSVVMLTGQVVKGMIARNRGHIVNISSIAGREAYHGGAIYCASKHALDAFSTATRHELVATNVRVTSIAPGAAKTEFSVIRFKGDVQRADAVYEGFDPLTAPDIADNILYALTRPLNVQVADMLVLANQQSSAKNLARVKLAQSS